MGSRSFVSDLVWRLGWTLLHSVWQLLVIGALVGLTLALLSRRSANLRYWIACLGMAGFYLPLVATFVFAPAPPSVAPVEPIAETPVSVPETETLVATPTIQPTIEVAPSETPIPVPPPIPVSEPIAPVSPPQISPAEPPALPTPTPPTPWFSQVLSPWLVWIVGGWLAVVGLLSLWNIGGWIVIQRVRKLATCPATESLCIRLRKLADQMGIKRRVRLVQSGRIDSPMVIGFLRPMILIPPSLMTGLTVDELDAILTHELAHIRRHDYLINLLQIFTETLLFYHPAVWMLSRRIRMEREFCCDDTAIAHCGGRTNYARALVAIEQQRQSPQFAMTFLRGDEKMTLRRIRRILGVTAGFPDAWLNGGGAFLVLVAIVLAGTISWNTLTAAANPANEGVESNEETPSSHKGSWGNETQGFQVRLRGKKTVWQVGEIPWFLADVKNHGERELAVTKAQQPCRLEVDGTWYDWTDGYALKTSPLPSGRQYDDVRIALVESWKSDTGRLSLAVGKHKIRVAFTAPAPNTKVRGALPSLRAISNPIEIEVIPNRQGDNSAWGEEKRGLRTRLSAQTHVFRAGYSVSLKLEIQNVTDEIVNIPWSNVTRADVFEVIDQKGREAKYLAGPAQLLEQQIPIQPDEVKTLATFDLSEQYHLREPGGYTVRLANHILPPSNRLRFEITSDTAANRDPIRHLLPLVKKSWQLNASPSHVKRRPGSNWQPTIGRYVSFQRNPPTSKRDREFVGLFIAEVPAKEEDENIARESAQPPNEYLGKLAHWHVYYFATAKAQSDWPTAKTDIKRALNSAVRNERGPSQVQARGKIDAIELLVSRLNTNDDLWRERISPVIKLPKYSRPKDVLEQAITKFRFEDRRISSYRIVEVRDVELKRWIGDGYRAVLFESNLGRKILICRYSDHQDWFVRFFDIPTENQKPMLEQEKAAMDDESYQRLHDRYKNLIRQAALKRDELQVAKLTQEFNRSLDQKLVFVQVTPRVGPLLQHRPVITATYRDTNPFGKIRFPVGTTKPYVQRLTNVKDGLEYVLVETNQPEHLKWPDDLQIRLVMLGDSNEKTEPWGKAQAGVQIRIRSVPLKGGAKGKAKRTWTTTDVPQFQIDIRNQGEANINYIPHPGFCGVEYDGTWYSRAGTFAYNGPATVLPPDTEKRGAFALPLTHGKKQGWVSKKDQKPLQLLPGNRTIRVALDALGTRLISNAVTIRVVPLVEISVGPMEKAEANKAADQNAQENEKAEPEIVREGRISWRLKGQEKHVWITDATDADLAKLAGQTDIVHLNMGQTKPDGLGPAGREPPSGVTDEGLKHLAQLKNLRVLILPHSGITDKGLVHLKDLKNLRELWLDFLSLTDAGLVHLKGLTKLKVLRFHGSKITDEGMENLKGMRDLEDLQLGGAILTDKSMPIIGQMTRLKTLDLRVKITDAGAAHLQNLTELDWLCLSGTKVGNEGLNHLTGLRKLKWLILEDTPVTDAGLPTIAKLSSLTTLYLSGCSLTDQGVKVLTQLPNLESLELSRTSITDQAVDSLVKMPHLNHLRLCDTKLSDSGLKKLEGHKPLTFLEIRRTRVTLDGVEQMREAKPKLMLQTDQNLPRTNLLKDGSFEKPVTNGAPWTTHGKGQLAGWTVESGTVDVVAQYWKAARGKQSLDLSGMINSPGTISQEIPTIPGQSYLVRFETAANPEPADAKNSKRLNVYWGDQELATLELFPEEQTFQDVGWQTFEYKVRADGKTGRLKFQSLTNTPCGPILDNISVTPIRKPN